MPAAILGWDVGGANVKAARHDEGAVKNAQRAFPLWREPGRLPKVLAEMAADLGGAQVMAVTMTAELADCFPTKRAGVRSVVDAFSIAFPDAVVRVYGVDGRFRPPADAKADPLRVAAANWMASATFAAREFPDAILIDTGTTTTDIVPIINGGVAAAGRTDTERLGTGELVYTGALRTPVCAIVRSVAVRGVACRVAAEVFAIAADAYRWLGELADEDYTCETPDGRGPSRDEAGRRLARMVCGDSEALDEDAITGIARNVFEAQVGQIAEGLRQVLDRLGQHAPSAAVIGGQGRFLARRAAARAGLAVTAPAREIGPATAVACLLSEER